MGKIYPQVLIIFFYPILLGSPSVFAQKGLSKDSARIVLVEEQKVSKKQTHAGVVKRQSKPSVIEFYASNGKLLKRLPFKGLESKVSASGDYVVVLEAIRSEEQPIEDLFKVFYSTSRKATWFNYEGQRVGEWFCNQLVSLKAISEYQGFGVFYGGGFIEPEFSEGGSPKLHWKGKHIQYTDMFFKEHADLTHKHIWVISHIGEIVLQIPVSITDFGSANDIFISPNGKWLVYSKSIYRSANYAYHIIDIQTGNENIFTGDLGSSRRIDDEGKLYGWRSDMEGPVWTPRNSTKEDK